MEKPIVQAPRPGAPKPKEIDISSVDMAAFEATMTTLRTFWMATPILLLVTSCTASPPTGAAKQPAERSARPPNLTIYVVDPHAPEEASSLTWMDQALQLANFGWPPGFYDISGQPVDLVQIFRQHGHERGVLRIVLRLRSDRTLGDISEVLREMKDAATRAGPSPDGISIYILTGFNGTDGMGRSVTPSTQRRTD
jgi:hypothetical protein